MQLFVVNPTGGKPRKARLIMASKRKSRPRKGGRRSLKSNPRRSRRLRRNPIGAAFRRAGRGTIGVMPLLTSGALGAVGGALLDVAMKPVPLAFKTGHLGNAVRIGGSIALGFIAGAIKVPGAADIARGAMTISLYKALQQYVTGPMGLGDLSDDDLAAMAEANDGMGAFVPQDALGYATPSDENTMSGLGAYVAPGVLDGADDY